MQTPKTQHTQASEQICDEDACACVQHILMRVRKANKQQNIERYIDKNRRVQKKVSQRTTKQKNCAGGGLPTSSPSPSLLLDHSRHRHTTSCETSSERPGIPLSSRKPCETSGRREGREKGAGRSSQRRARASGESRRSADCHRERKNKETATKMGATLPTLPLQISSLPQIKKSTAVHFSWVYAGRKRPLPATPGATAIFIHNARRAKYDLRRKRTRYQNAERTSSVSFLGCSATQILQCVSTSLLPAPRVLKVHSPKEEEDKHYFC